MLNLLHIGKFYPPYHGGMETYLKDLVEAQVRQGHQVTVLVHNHNWGILKSKTSIEKPLSGLTVIRQSCWRPVLFTPLMRGLNKRVKHLINNNQVDLIHLHVPNPSIFFLLFNKVAKKVPWVIRWHADMVTESSSWLMRCLYRLIKPIESRLIQQSNRVLISTADYAKKSQVLHELKSKVSVIPLGLNTRTYKPSAVKSIHDKPFQVLALGRLSYYKNHRLLIDALTQIPDMHLNVVGGGPLLNSLKDYAISRRVNDRITLTGPVSEALKQQHIDNAHVVCLASNDRAESYGMVLLEAMACEKIVLAADTAGSGMRWLADRYGRGFTFHNEDCSDLVLKLNHIRDHYNTIVKQVIDFDLSIDETAQSISHLYQSTLNLESP